MQRIVHFYYHEYLLYNAIAFLIKFVKITQVGNLQIKYEIRVKCYAKQSTKSHTTTLIQFSLKKKPHYSIICSTKHIDQPKQNQHLWPCRIHVETKIGEIIALYHTI